MVWGRFTAREVLALHFVPKDKIVDGPHYRDKILKPAFEEFRSRKQNQFHAKTKLVSGFDELAF